jgi:RND family efflux transporter MFP subunit
MHKGVLALLVAAGLAVVFAAKPDLLNAFNGRAPNVKGAEKADDIVGPATAPAISVAKVSMIGFVETVLLTGSIVAREEILVVPEVEGLRVLELFADEADIVTKGQILARLVNETLEAQIAQNDAAQARASAAIAQARSHIAQAEAAVKEAGNAFGRAKPLKRDGYLSDAAYDQRESSAITAEFKLAAARDGLKLAEAEKAQVEAQRRELDWKRANTEVKSPADGLVSRRAARIGAMASGTAEPMFRIIAKGEVELDGEVTEADLSKIRAGQAAQVAVAGAADVIGRVRLVSPEVDKSARLGRVKVFIGNNPGVHVGAYGRAVVETAKSRGPGVPLAAIVFSADRATVQSVVESRVVTRWVKTGLRTADAIEIREGLSEGDLIVTKAGTFVRDGDLIRSVLSASRLSTDNGGGEAEVNSKKTREAR